MTALVQTYWFGMFRNLSVHLHTSLLIVPMLHLQNFLQDQEEYQLKDYSDRFLVGELVHFDGQGFHQQL